MAEYIEREALIKRLEHEVDSSTSIVDTLVINALAQFVRDERLAPTVDVVEVVRCKDCCHSILAEGMLVDCTYWNEPVSVNGFCHCGKRKNEEPYCSCGERKDGADFPQKKMNIKQEKRKEAIYLGFSSHDCEAHYKCPVCNKNFGDWSLPRGKQAKKCCPWCNTELDGLE